MPTPDVNPVPTLRRLLSQRPSVMLQTAAPELAKALPLLVQFFDRYERLEGRILELERIAAVDAVDRLVQLAASR